MGALRALKKIRKGYSQETRARRLFDQEAKIALRLVHPNIVRTHEVFESHGALVLVMECVKGRTLERLMRDWSSSSRAAPLQDKLFVATEICRGLEYAYETVDETTGRPLEIVHCDVSPKNVMVSSIGEIKLLDFGIATMKGTCVRRESSAIGGTLNYLAPEIFLGVAPDHRSDLFSLSVILFELIAGAPLFKNGAAESSAEPMVKSRVEELPIPSQVKALLLKGLHADPERRTQTAREYRSALLRALQPRADGPRLGDSLKETADGIKTGMMLHNHARSVHHLVDVTDVARSKRCYLAKGAGYATVRP